jgi:hypothetical protein
MKLNENTLALLENYSGINANICITAGKVIKTMAEARNVMSVATLDQEFEQDFGIYDLKEFLNVLNLVEDPELTFTDEHVTVSDSTGRVAVKYFFSDPSILTSPTKDITMPECEVSFTLDQNTLSRIRKASGVLGHDKMCITPSGDGNILISITETEDSTSNSFSIEVPGTAGEVDFSFVMNISNLKMISGDYEVDVSSRLLSRFKNKSTDVVYYIALEKSSKYGE